MDPSDHYKRQFAWRDWSTALDALPAVEGRTVLDLGCALTLADREFAFDGAADADVLAGWRTRLEGMRLLHAFCGPDAERVREESLACLASEEHRSHSTVRCCIATKGSGSA